MRKPLNVLMLAAGLCASLAPGAAARRAAPAPCDGGRYLLQGEPLIAGTSAPSADALALSAAAVAIGDVCPATRPKKLRATRKGTTKVVVVWSACRGLTGRVKLRADLLDGCARLHGTLKARHFKRTLDATHSRCGDSGIDTAGGEQCEPPGTADCDAFCRAVPPLPTTTTTTVSTTSTTVGGPLDVWRPATVPFDPTCPRGCDEVEHSDVLAHLGVDARFLYDRAVDDPIAQWGDCLQSMLECLRRKEGVRACAAAASCPDPCKTLFASRAPATADELTLLGVLNGVYVDRGAPCRPVEEVTP